MRTLTRAHCRLALTALLLVALILSACAEDEVLQPAWTWEYGGDGNPVLELVYSDDAVWAGFTGSIRRVGTEDGEPEAEIPIDGIPTAMTTAADGTIWVAVARSTGEPGGPATPAGTEIVGIDPASNSVDTKLPTGLATGVEILDIAVLDEIWISTEGAEVIAIDRATGTARRVLKSVTVLDGLVAASGKIWMLRNQSVVTALDPATGKTTVQRDLPGDTIEGEQASDPPISVSGDSLWVVRGGKPPVVVLDSESGEVTDEINLPAGWGDEWNMAPLGDKVYLTHGKGETSLLAVDASGGTDELSLAARQYGNLIAHGDALYMTVHTSGSKGAVQRYPIPGTAP